MEPFSPITLGVRLRTLNLGDFVLTETEHQPKQRLPRHCHELANIAFVLSGSFTEVLDRKSIECEPQSLLIKPAGEAHANRYGQAGMHCLLIELTNQQSDAGFVYSRALNEVTHLRIGNMAALGWRIYKELRLMDSATPLAIEGLILELLATISRQRNVSIGRVPPYWLNQVKDLLETHFSQEMKLARLAALVNVHPVHLARAFRQHFGCTIGDYVRNVRINFACDQLRHSDKSIAEIALAAGFADQSHFSRVLKMNFGVTPKQFRTNLRSSLR